MKNLFVNLFKKNTGKTRSVKVPKFDPNSIKCFDPAAYSEKEIQKSIERDRRQWDNYYRMKANETEEERKSAEEVIAKITAIIEEMESHNTGESAFEEALRKFEILAKKMEKTTEA